MVDSGTLGTKASVQVVVPFLTESYSSTNDPPDPSVPMCTLRNFPNLIEHTIEWARDNFAGLFTIPAQQAEEFKRGPKELAERTAKNHSDYDKNEIIENVKRILGPDRPKTFTDCIKWVSSLFHRLQSSSSTSSHAIFSNNNSTTPLRNYSTTFLVIISQAKVNVSGVEINVVQVY